MRFSRGAPLALLGLGIFIPWVGAENPWGDPDVVLAIIDTGVRPTHMEFTYKGPGDPTDSFVGWWDFTDEVAPLHRPSPGEVWDPVVPQPYDNQGHGTATTSLAVGKNLSFCKGCKVAVAKVFKGGTASEEDIVEAIRWAVEDVGADIVSLSLGSIIPSPGAFTALDEAVERAYRAGVLVVVAGGNGNANAGVPGAWTEITPLGFSPYALVVGAASSTGSPSLTYHSDPEVTSWGLQITTAFSTGDSSTRTWSGTSFSTPRVAGMAASLLSLAGPSCRTPDYLETLLKFSAQDTIYPYTFEGYGFLGADQFNFAKTFAPSCTLPLRSSTDINRRISEGVSDPLRKGVTEGADYESVFRWIFVDTPPTSSSGSIEPSLPGGVSEIEIWRLSVSAGERVRIEMNYGPVNPPQLSSVNDLDLYLFKPGSLDDGVLGGEEVLARSAQSAQTAEEISYRFKEAGTYIVAVVGRSVAVDQPYTLSSTGGVLTFEGEKVAVGVTGVF